MVELLKELIGLNILEVPTALETVPENKVAVAPGFKNLVNRFPIFAERF